MTIRINLKGKGITNKRPGWLEEEAFRNGNLDLYPIGSQGRNAQVEKILQKRFRSDFLDGKDILIIGMGRNFDEGRMFLRYFPGIRTLHIVEWDEGKDSDIREEFERGIREGKVRVHWEDARRMPRIRDQGMHFIYFSALWDLHVKEDLKKIFAEIYRCLSPGGCVLSLDFEVCNPVYLQRMGMHKIYNEVYRK
jgi:hypothetical protein